jgi:hypothetical protein
MLDLRIGKNGSLSQIAGEYVCWFPDSPQIALDGEFTSAELRTLADHMDRHQKVKTEDTGEHTP